jgi:hypothetical protein
MDTHQSRPTGRPNHKGVAMDSPATAEQVTEPGTDDKPDTDPTPTGDPAEQDEPEPDHTTTD